MKKMLFLAAIVFFTMAAKAQTGTTNTAKPMMTLKDHVCTAACKDGQHMYAHGEKGHVCTAACKKNKNVSM